MSLYSYDTSHSRLLARRPMAVCAALVAVGLAIAISWGALDIAKHRRLAADFLPADLPVEARDVCLQLLEDRFCSSRQSGATYTVPLRPHGVHIIHSDALDRTFLAHCFVRIQYMKREYWWAKWLPSKAPVTAIGPFQVVCALPLADGRSWVFENVRDVIDFVVSNRYTIRNEDDAQALAVLLQEAGVLYRLPFVSYEHYEKQKWRIGIQRTEDTLSYLELNVDNEGHVIAGRFARSRQRNSSAQDQKRKEENGTDVTTIVNRGRR